MKYLKCILFVKSFCAVLLLLTVAIASAAPPQSPAPPQAPSVQAQLDNHEQRLQAIERKIAVAPPVRERIASAEPIELYSASWCTLCPSANRDLQALGASYVVKDGNGMGTLPLIRYKGRNRVVGYDANAIAAVVAEQKAEGGMQSSQSNAKDMSRCTCGADCTCKDCGCLARPSTASYTTVGATIDSGNVFYPVSSQSAFLGEGCVGGNCGSSASSFSSEVRVKKGLFGRTKIVTR